MSDAEVRLDVEGPVATVTLNRPHVLNAQTPQMWLDLAAIGRDLPGDVRVVVVRGEGRAFSAGLDLEQAKDALPQLATMPSDEAEARIATYQAAFDWLRRPDIISIAAVRGHAIGAGQQRARRLPLPGIPGMRGSQFGPRHGTDRLSCREDRRDGSAPV